MMLAYILGDGPHGRMLAKIVGGKCFGEEDELPVSGNFYVGVGDTVLRKKIWASSPRRHFPALIMGGNHGKVSAGSHLMHGSLIMHGTVVHENVLINTGAQVDHDCVIGAHSHIAPGAILCGNVTLGEETFVGAGAIILQGVTLNARSSVPAGTLVVGSNDFRRPQRVFFDR